MLLHLAACVDFLPDEPGSSGWGAEIGVPDQSIPLADLEITDRDAWLARRPRVVVDAGFASLAVLFEPDSDPTQVRLQGLFDTGDQQVWIHSSDAGSTSGLDHDLSWTVRIEADDQQLDQVWIAADLAGDPGCGGDSLPRSVAVFDADRQPLDWDGDTVHLAAVDVAFVIPVHGCHVAE